MSETRKHRAQTLRYCEGNGLDLGSAGDPIRPESIQVEPRAFYCPFLAHAYPPQLRGSAADLVWFKDQVMDYVYSSHLIEDFDAKGQKALIEEWCRVVVPGGYLVILAPEKKRWAEALAKGQPPNEYHKHEPMVYELRQHLPPDWAVIEDRFCDETDYSLLFVARRR